MIIRSWLTDADHFTVYLQGSYHALSIWANYIKVLSTGGVLFFVKDPNVEYDPVVIVDISVLSEVSYNNGCFGDDYKSFDITPLIREEYEMQKEIDKRLYK